MFILVIDIRALVYFIAFSEVDEHFRMIHDADAKEYKVGISQANLFVRKRTVIGNVYSAIESPLVKTPGIYRFTEITPKTFNVTKGIESWNKGDILNHESIRRFALAMTTN